MIDIKKKWNWVDDEDELLEQGVDNFISTPKESGAVED